MAIPGKVFKIFSILGSCKNVFGNVNRYNFPSLTQISSLKRQSLEEKYNIPEKPKRPLTPYFKFMAQLRPQLQKENPNNKLTEFVKESAARWEKIDPQIKQKMEEEYKKEQEIYIKQKLDFETKLTDEQKTAIKEARIARSESKQKRKYKKKCRDNNKPKRPGSAYVLYLKSQLPSRGSQNFHEWQMQLSKKWNNLSDEEKKPFMDEMKDGYKEYQIKMTAWERDMIKQGNLDLVRQDALIEPKQVKKVSKSKKSE